MSYPVPDLPGLTDLAPLGRGGLADVHLARQVHLDRWVAAKVFRVTLADATAAERFRAECRAIGRLDQYPHVITVYDAGVLPDGRPYLISERCDGSLHDLVTLRGPLDRDRVVTIGATIGRALRYAHSAGVLHGDVTPANVLLRASGAPVLADFGLAVLRDHAQRAAGFTAVHAAPEVQREGAPIDTRADVYGLGSTLWTALTGTPPRYWDEDEDPDDRHDPDDRLTELLGAMLAPGPADRPSVDAVIDTLEAGGRTRATRDRDTLVVTSAGPPDAAGTPDDDAPQPPVVSEPPPTPAAPDAPATPSTPPATARYATTAATRSDPPATTRSEPPTTGREEPSATERLEVPATGRSGPPEHDAGARVPPAAGPRRVGARTSGPRGRRRTLLVAGGATAALLLAGAGAAAVVWRTTDGTPDRPAPAMLPPITFAPPSPSVTAPPAGPTALPTAPPARTAAPSRPDPTGTRRPTTPARPAPPPVTYPRPPVPTGGPAPAPAPSGPQTPAAPRPGTPGSAPAPAPAPSGGGARDRPAVQDRFAAPGGAEPGGTQSGASTRGPSGAGPPGAGTTGSPPVR